MSFYLSGFLSSFSVHQHMVYIDRSFYKQCIRNRLVPVSGPLLKVLQISQIPMCSDGSCALAPPWTSLLANVMGTSYICYQFSSQIQNLYPWMWFLIHIHEKLVQVITNGPVLHGYTKKITSKGRHSGPFLNKVKVVTFKVI